MLTLQELYTSIQKEEDSIKHIHSLAHNTQVFRFRMVIMMLPLKIHLKYEH